MNHTECLTALKQVMSQRNNLLVSARRLANMARRDQWLPYQHGHFDDLEKAIKEIEEVPKWTA